MGDSHDWSVADLYEMINEMRVRISVLENLIAKLTRIKESE